jgi:hypothetical protein
MRYVKINLYVFISETWALNGDSSEGALAAKESWWLVQTSAIPCANYTSGACRRSRTVQAVILSEVEKATGRLFN